LTAAQGGVTDAFDEALAGFGMIERKYGGQDWQQSQPPYERVAAGAATSAVA
jgi:hypothetical protein